MHMYKWIGGTLLAVWTLSFGLVVFATDLDILKFIPSMVNAAARTESRTAISSPGYVISSPGSYYLTQNIRVESSDGFGVKITADNVTLDLNGFSMGSPEAIGSTRGVYIFDAKNVEIRNGTLHNCGESGVEAEGECRSLRFIDLRVKSNFICGMYLAGSGHIIRGCTAVGNGQQGFFAQDSIIQDSSSYFNRTGVYLDGGSLINSLVHDNAEYGVQASNALIRNCTISDNGYSGITASYCTILQNQIQGNNKENISTDAGLLVNNTCLVKDNMFFGNNYYNVYMTSINSSVENNLLVGSAVNFQAWGDFNYLAGNKAGGASEDYVVASNNTNGGNISLDP